MEELALVRDLAIVWLAALIVGAASVRLKLPAIAGYIVAGLAIGPFGLRLIAESGQVKVLAELGVALLLFALGVELSVRKILSSFGSSSLSAFIQIAGTALAASAIGLATGMVPNTVSAIVFGIICSLSSTAVVTKLLVDRAETETLHGRAIVPILLFQDLSLVPVVALLPALHFEGNALATVLPAIGKAILLIVGVIILAIAVVPRLLSSVAKTNSRELFLLTVISLCLTVALLSRALGVSLALGAFLAGVMISEKPHGRQVLADITPITDLFSTLFFVSIGMLLDPVFIMAHWEEVLVFVILLLIGKAVIGALAVFPATRSVWSSILAGIAIAQIGEFSFVLATLAFEAGLLSKALYNLFFAGSVVTLAVSPVMIAAAPKLLSRIPIMRLLRRRQRADEEDFKVMTDHLVLLGYGRMGSSIGRTLHANSVPLIVVEIDGGVAELLAQSGIPYIYGDAFNSIVLEKANLKHARCMVVTIPDHMVALHVIALARSENPDIQVIVRASRLSDVQLFHSHGADVVVQPEFEASIEATKMAMSRMNRPQEEIINAVRQIRSQGNTIFRQIPN